MATLVGELLLSVTAAQARPTPAQRCQADKNDAAGMYATCRQGAEATLAMTGNTAKYDRATLGCSYRFARRWLQVESRVARKGETCPDEPLDEGTLQTSIDECTTNVATALAGGGLFDCPAILTTCQADLSACEAAAAHCGNGTIEAPEQCDGANLTGQTCATRPGFTLGTLRCASGCTFDTSGCFATRFVDNGDGTVTDNQIGLQWEKKTGTVGEGLSCIGLDACSDAHDVNNSYKWTNDETAASGEAFTNFLGRLNGAYDGMCFAGHCNWRLPTVEELQTILLYPYPCGPIPCIDPILGSTSDFFYWSVTTEANAPSVAWFVVLATGYVRVADKNFFGLVRAVRNGS